MSGQVVGKPLQPYDEIRTPKKPVPQGRERFASLIDEELRAYVRSLPCLACTILGEEQREPTEACHVTTKGIGGGDHDNLINLCSAHHRQWHNIGRRSFDYRYKIRSKAVARKLTATYIAKRKHGL